MQKINLVLYFILKEKILFMNDRVDYLSDKLVNLRGRLKNVEEVVPKDSIVNGVSAPAAKTAKESGANSAQSASQALDRRREQTCQLFADYEQRLVRRMRQLEVKSSMLERSLEEVKVLQNALRGRQEELNKLRIAESDVLSQVELGERFRAIDQKRLAFYACDGEIELVLAGNSQTAVSDAPAAPAVDDFKTMVKKGWALALTLGAVVGVSVIISALIVFFAWR